MTSADQQVEFGQRLRALADRPVASKADLDGWYAAAQQLQVGLPPGLNLPEIFWHYLSDADIRLRDHQYARMQDAQVRQLIADLEAGRVPTSKHDEQPSRQGGKS